MCFATLLPLGVIQLYESVAHGYYEARSLEFLTNDTNALIEWLRLPGDVVFIVGGVLPVIYLGWLGVRHTVPRTTIEEPEDILFTEITEPSGEKPRRPMSGLDPEVLLAAGYAAFLLVASVALDGLARHTHRRSERYRTAGFQYHAGHDAWQCGEGHHLRLHALDHERRVARYRARAAVCNRCTAKPGCTDSDDGREVVRPLDPWPRSEAGRFQRGISLALVALALLIALVAGARHHAAAELALLGASALAAVLVGLRLVADFRAHPAGFPRSSA